MPTVSPGLSLVGAIMVAVTLACAPQPPKPGVAITNAQGQKVYIRVEVADAPEKWRQGLANRTALAEDAGMLFLFPEPIVQAFWTKDTPLPLSIAFISQEGQIIHIEDMEPFSEERHSPPRPAKYALEVQRGFFQRRHIGVGDRVQFNLD